MSVPAIHDAHSVARPSSRPASLRVALAGNPNVGKSTLFSVLTGISQHTGNWPGKTVEKREGTAHLHGHSLKVIDLPGTSSLAGRSVEERIVREYLLGEKPDVVAVVADVTNLERNLYMLLEVLELTDRVILALNMVDLAEKEKITLNLPALQGRLGVPVVAVAAASGRGIKDLVAAVIQSASGGHPETLLDYGAPLEPALARVEELLRTHGFRGYPPRWSALRLLMDDPEIVQRLEEMPRRSG